MVVVRGLVSLCCRVLVGVCLTDCEEDYAGNLLVWPRTHWPIHLCTSGRNGAIDVHRLQALLSDAHIGQRAFDSRLPPLPVDPVGDGSDADKGQAPSLSLSRGGQDETAVVVSDGVTETSGGKMHENEPTDLPYLGAPLSVKCRAGVRLCMID